MVKELPLLVINKKKTWRRNTVSGNSNQRPKSKPKSFLWFIAGPVSDSTETIQSGKMGYFTL